MIWGNTAAGEGWQNSANATDLLGRKILKSIIVTVVVLGFAAGVFGAYLGDAGSGQQAAADNPALAAPVPAGAVRGKVLETMNSGGYTYVYVETDKDKRWIATRQTAVSAGDIVQAHEGMAMPGFTSRTLNRTFDVVYFVDGIVNLSASSQPADHPGGGMPEGRPEESPAPAAQSADVRVEAVEPGHDIAWVYANKGDLAGQQISLRGKVVKYNDGIMGRNWIHIQDGSGNAADRSNDLTVTTDDPAAMGQTVVVTGTIVLDQDFGAGYSYPVMMEQATVSTEPATM